MKITLSGGTAIEEEGGVVQLDSTVISMYKRPKQAHAAELVFAYCLRPGEQIRRVSKDEYEVIF